MDEYSTLGKPIERYRFNELVTGKALFTNDIKLPGMLTGKLLYAAHPCAEIIRLDVSRAKKLPGVVAVITHEDVPGENSYFYLSGDQPLFASDAVHYQGDILAAVAAEDENTAMAALELIVVEYNPIHGVFDMREAIKPESEKVWKNRDNLLDHLTISLGDIKDGFKQADVIIENTYYTGRAEPAPLETEGAVAQIEIDGSIVVYSSTQAPNKDRIQIARALGISENQVRVITPFIGGGFGSKIEAHVQIHAALLAQATGKPVKIIRSREEAIRSHVKRHPFYLECRTGARRDGTITAVEVKAYADTGPYINLGPEVVGVAVMNSSGPYYTPNALLEGFTVMTNNPIGGAMRGFGGPQAAFAYETQMDLLAETLKMDPLEIRLKNGLGTGMQVPTGAKIRQGDGMRACLEEAARLIEWDKRKEKESKPAAHLRRGWGLAAHVFTLAYGRKIPDNAGVVLELAGDGTLSLRTGAADIGQGLHTALAQLASESLGIEVSQVRVISPDTEKTLDSGATNASRSVIISGQAAVQAAREIKKTLLITASEETGLPIEVLNLKNGWLTAEGERINMSVKDLANKSRRLNRSISAIGYYAVEYPEPLPPNSYPHAPNIYTFGAQAAQVLVDIETGQVMIEKLVAVHDAGLIVNPFGALGQIEGGAAMGIGYALMEEIHSEKGQILTDSLDTYLLPTAKDIPPMEVKILEFPEPYTPFGVKGIGEVGILPTAPAITNAIHDATGISINCIPMTAERVLKSLAALKDDQIN